MAVQALEEEQALPLVPRNTFRLYVGEDVRVATDKAAGARHEEEAAMQAVCEQRLPSSSAPRSAPDHCG